MTSVTVLHEFRDKDNFAKVYEVGKSYTLDESRAKELSERGLVKIGDAGTGGKRKGKINKTTLA